MNTADRIYLDANATTPLLPEVFKAMHPWLLESFGNPSSTHRQGQAARAAVDHARDQIARLLHCRASEIIFTASGTESDNLALFGTLAPGDHLITTTTEHHAVLHAAQHLEKQGIQVTYLPCDSNGAVSFLDLEKAFRPNTKLVSILFANNETGVIQDIPHLAAITKEHGVLFHTDAVQAVGKLPIDLTADLKNVDLLSLSGHKLYAPQGTGVLFVRRKTPLRPMLHGGAHERQRRAGTENVPGIVALGAAAAAAHSWLNRQDRTPSITPSAMGGSTPDSLLSLHTHLESTVLTTIPHVIVNGAPSPRVPNTTSLTLPGLEAESLLIALDLAGVSVSAGSACQSGATEPSHVLTAMGLPHALARATIRISLSRLTNVDEIDRFLAILTPTVARLRTLAPATLIQSS